MDFYNYFSFSAKKALYRASEICAQFNNQYVEPEHIFYSILNLRSCSAVQVMHELNVNLPKLTYSLEAHLFEHSGDYKGSASFSTRTLALLDIAFKEVKRLHHREIGTAHLLVALSQEHSQFLHNLFEEHELDHKKIRSTFMKHLKGYSQGFERATTTMEPEAPGKPTNLFGFARGVMSAACQKLMIRAAMQGMQTGAEEISLLHLFSAILEDQQCSANIILRQLGMELLDARESLQAERKEGNAEPKIPWRMSVDCQNMLLLCQDLQQRLRQRELMTAHILMGMANEVPAELTALFERYEITTGRVLKAYLDYLLEDRSIVE